MLSAQLARVKLAVEQNVAPDPLKIRLLRADAVVLDADDLAHAVQETSTRYKPALVVHCRFFELTSGAWQR